MNTKITITSTSPLSLDTRYEAVYPYLAPHSRDEFVFQFVERDKNGGHQFLGEMELKDNVYTYALEVDTEVGGLPRTRRIEFTEVPEPHPPALWVGLSLSANTAALLAHLVGEHSLGYAGFALASAAGLLAVWAVHKQDDPATGEFVEVTV